MSNMIPARTIAALRGFNNVAVNIYGIDVTLYVLSNKNTIEVFDADITEADKVYNSYTVKAHIEWKPSMYKLKKLGMFNENDLPIIAHFDNTHDIVPGSYIKVPIQYLPSSITDTDEFEIVNSMMNEVHDMAIRTTYLLAPKRK